MPLDKAYDKLIDFEERRHEEHRRALGRRRLRPRSSCSASSRIRRGRTSTSPAPRWTARNDINQSWGSGWGVRLLDRFVAEHYEKSEK